jgi:hypothetical protein
MMESLCGEALLSLEGDLGRCAAELAAWPGMQTSETEHLRRQTLSLGLTEHQASHDFVVLPLDYELVAMALPPIMTRLGIRRNVWHVQIEMGGALQFASYDQLSDKLAHCGPLVSERTLDQLIDRTILWGYSPFRDDGWRTS